MLVQNKWYLVEALQRAERLHGRDELQRQVIDLNCGAQLQFGDDIEAVRPANSLGAVGVLLVVVLEVNLENSNVCYAVINFSAPY